LIVVVLPAPLRPTRPKISPASMSRLRPFTAVSLAKRRVSSRVDIEFKALVERRYGAPMGEVEVLAAA
jgi:hypothetical protein